MGIEHIKMPTKSLPAQSVFFSDVCGTNMPSLLRIITSSLKHLQIKFIDFPDDFGMNMTLSHMTNDNLQISINICKPSPFIFSTC